MAAAILQMAVLAGAGVEQRPQSVGGIGRGRRRYPALAEDAVADLEIELALEIHVAGGEREGVGGRGRAARRGTAAGFILSLFELGEVRGGLNQVFGGSIGAFAMSLEDAGKERQSRAEEDCADQARRTRPSRRSALRQLCVGTGMGCVHASFFRSLSWCVPPQPLRPRRPPRCRRAGRYTGSSAVATSRD